MDDNDILENLNEEQCEAVTATEGYIRIIAGAGSGKTRALSHRFAFLVNEIGILPGNILCVTFTNKSANEMRQRIHRLTGDSDTGYISTFHGFCVTVLQEDANTVQYPKSFLVLDNADIDDMLKIIYEDRNLSLRDKTFAKARDLIEDMKLVRKPLYYQNMISMSVDMLREKYISAETTDDIIFYGYLYQEKKCFGLDYNDLIKFTLHIFKTFPDVCLKWQQRLEYIMIDEFQDIDGPQYELMEILSGYHKNLFIVGDPDQTIYTWRGADVRYLLDFDKHFRDVKTIIMNQNYRSTPQILAAANSLIETNTLRIKKDLISKCADGGRVVCHHDKSTDGEAEWVAKKIEDLHRSGISYHDITVLYRAHYITRVIEEIFIKEKIPYTIYSGTQFFCRLEIKDALSYLRMIVYKDDLSFQRIVNVPKRCIGKSRIKAIAQYAEENHCTLYEALKSLADSKNFQNTGAAAFIGLIDSFGAEYASKSISEVLTEILDKSGYERMLRTEGSQERLDNLAELKQSVYEYETTCGEETTLERYLNHIAMFSNQDTSMISDKVKLMTVHAAKGLEFPYVFLCALNEGIFPSKRTNTRESMEEERRLAFVAMTRAQRGLYLTDAEGVNLDHSFRHQSRFIWEIDPELMEFEPPRDAALIADAQNYTKIMNHSMTMTDKKLEKGDKIKHAVFGTGTIVNVLEEKSAYEIQFDSMETVRTISFRVKLTKL